MAEEEWTDEWMSSFDSMVNQPVKYFKDSEAWNTFLLFQNLFTKARNFSHYISSVHGV